MQFYWSRKRVPEFHQYTNKEFYQLRWAAGLKPLGHWQAWAGIFLAALIILLGTELIGGAIFLGALQGWSENAFFFSFIIILVSGTAVYRHFYLQALRLHRDPARIRKGAGWPGVLVRSWVLSALTLVLVVMSMLLIDGLINAYDEGLDSRAAEISIWPEPLPDEKNGFIALAGMQAAKGKVPFEAGKSWLEAVKITSETRSDKFPMQPNELKYVEMVEQHPLNAGTGAVKKPAKPKTRGLFCRAGTESCIEILKRESKSVHEWMAANNELLNRYLALRKYPLWQFKMPGWSPFSPFPSYNGLARGQNLLQAAALQEWQSGQAVSALDKLSSDMQFARQLLASQDSLIGKMVASEMLARDVSLISEMLDAQPALARMHHSRLENMLKVLSPAEISIEHAIRFELKSMVNATIQMSFEDYLRYIKGLSLEEGEAERLPVMDRLGYRWGFHHFKRNATLNMLIANFEQMMSQIVVHDALHTPHLDFKSDHARWYALAKWPGIYNQVGQALLVIGQPSYEEYQNRVYNLNALNTLIRLRLAMLAKDVKADAVPAYLAAAEKSLQNPLTGKPFEWDAERAQVHFTPSINSYQPRSFMGGVKNRIGFSVSR